MAVVSSDNSDGEIDDRADIYALIDDDSDQEENPVVLDF